MERIKIDLIREKFHNSMKRANENLWLYCKQQDLIRYYHFEEDERIKSEIQIEIEKIRAKWSEHADIIKMENAHASNL